MSGPRDRDPERDAELARLGEPPVSAAERADAASLARLVDDMLDGRAAPPAMDAEERALLEAATQVHASLGEAGLAPARTKLLLDGIFPASRPATVAPRAGSVSRLDVRPRRSVRLGRVLPWAVASLCAAAALALWVRVPDPGATTRSSSVVPSADAVIGGPIAREQAGDASSRLDALVADRRARVRGAAGAVR